MEETEIMLKGPTVDVVEDKDGNLAHKGDLVKQLLDKLSVKDLQALLIAVKPKKKTTKKKAAVKQKKKVGAAEVETAPKKRGRPHKVVETVEPESEQEFGFGDEYNEEYNEEGVNPTNYIRRPVKKRNQPRIHSGQSKIPCRTSDFEVGKKRPNKFLQSADAKSCKDDAQLDKVLLKGVKPTRRRQASDMVEIQCRKCRQYVEVFPASIMCSADRYVCNDCTRG